VEYWTTHETGAWRPGELPPDWPAVTSDGSPADSLEPAGLEPGQEAGSLARLSDGSPSDMTDGPQTRYRIRGGHPLHGTVFVQGAKNAALKMIAASLLA
jgi:hypothetical protein